MPSSSTGAGLEEESQGLEEARGEGQSTGCWTAEEEMGLGQLLNRAQAPEALCGRRLISASCLEVPSLS